MLQFKLSSAQIQAIRFPYGFKSSDLVYSLMVSDNKLTLGVKMLEGGIAWVEIPVNVNTNGKEICVGVNERLRNIPLGDYDISVDDKQVIFECVGNKYVFPIHNNYSRFAMPENTVYDGNIPLSFNELLKSFERVSTKMGGTYPFIINPDSAMYVATSNVACSAVWKDVLKLIDNELILKREGLIPMAKYFNSLSGFSGSVSYTIAKDKFCTFKFQDSGISYYLQLASHTLTRKVTIPASSNTTFGIGKDFWESMQLMTSLSGAKAQCLVSDNGSTYIFDDATGSKRNITIDGTLSEKFIYAVEDIQGFVPPIPMQVSLDEKASFFIYDSGDYKITVILARIQG